MRIFNCQLPQVLFRINSRLYNILEKIELFEWSIETIRLISRIKSRNGIALN